MCGIAGILLFNRVVSKEQLKIMTDVIQHRGPDGEGQWVNPDQRVGFGHRRLSIIDLSNKASQPMHYLHGRYTITFNGEIYNYIELKESLIRDGYTFMSDSDTEVLLALYDQKKEKCLDDLDGMFAFAIWDEKEGVLFCARDRFGEKPFYYYSDNSSFVFASEMKSIWAYGVLKSPNDEAFNYYIDTNLVAIDGASTTFYKNVFQLNPAHYLIIQAEKTKISRYYFLNEIDVNSTISFSEAKHKFFTLLSNSIKLRLRSDVPVGSSLSGGLDSSSIVRLIDIIKGKDTIQKSFTARFKDFEKDEGIYVEKVLRTCANIQSYTTWPGQLDFQECLDKLVYHQEEPFGSASIYAQYKVMELAAQNNITVLLDGQGADEQLAGYISYYRLYLNQLFYHERRKYNTEYSAYNTLHGKRYPLINLSEEETVRMKVGRIRRSLLGLKLPAEKNELKNSLKRDLQTTGLRNLLRYADRNSMAHSREIRLPFLNHKLVEFVLSLPDEFILKNGWTKYVMREAMKDYLPNEIVWRVDKIGYETPQSAWLKNEAISNEIETSRIYYKDLLQKRDISDWQMLMINRYYK